MRGFGQPVVTPRSPRFIPGGLLPLIIGRLAYEPMLLDTEAIPAPGSPTSSRPLLIRLEPSFDAPEYLGGSTEPLRCWILRINGARDSSRWYIDESGGLSLVRFAAGLRVHPLLEDPPAAQPAPE